MEVLLLILLMAFATVIVAMWIAARVVAILVRAVLWGVRAPFRTARYTGALPTPRAMLIDVGGVRCQNRLCTSPLPGEARFCPRCGKAGRRGHLEALPLVMPTVSRVA